MRTDRVRRALAGRASLLVRPQRAELVAALRAPVASVVFDPLQAGRPLRVLLAYVFWDYGMSRRGVSYETTAFRDPLYHLGCEIVEARIDELKAKYGTSGASSALFELAFRHDVDAVFAIPFTNEIDPRVLRSVRESLHVPVICWFSDDHWRFDSYTVQFLPNITAAVTTSEGAVSKYRNLGFSNIIHSQWSANHRIFRPLALPPAYEVSFVGQPHSDRRQLVARLRSAGIQVETRGFGWKEGRVSLSEMVRLGNQSQICLNFGNASAGGLHQVKGRDFEIPAMGRPLLTAYSTELRQYFNEEEAATYRTGEELVAVVQDLLKDESRRERMATAGRQRLLKDHTAEHRLAEIFNHAARNGWLSR